MHWNPKNDQFLVHKSKIFSSTLPAANVTTFGLEFIVDAKAENSVFWKISYSGIFSTWVALKSNMKIKLAFSITKIFRKCKIKRNEPS